ncbi:MAG: ExeM/NucH family extracellular endonuclease [Anaerolineae bacterium]
MNTHVRLSKVQVIVAIVSLLASFFAGAVSPARADSTSLLITGVIDGPLSGGVPKAVEFYVLEDITDLSTYGFGSANNGGGSDGEEFTFPAVSAAAGTFIYVAHETAASEVTGFEAFFGFAPDYISSAASINGDDAIELFHNGSVVDVFGDINTDGSGQPWEYMDGWAYRVDGTGPDGATFVLANWSFSGPNALDGETSNAAATTPFPIGTYSPGGGPTYTPIYDIQYTTDPSGDSPYKDQTDVTTEGIVTARFYNGYFIQDPGGGAWNGLWVFDNTNTPALGDRVRLTGTVAEYDNLTELTSLTDYEVISGGNPIPGPVILSTGDVSQEQWEGVLVRVENVTVTNDDLGYGEWSVSDGSGDVRIDDKGSYTYAPTNGDALSALVGPLDYSYGNFKIQPRDDGDIILPTPPSALLINEVLADPAGDLSGDANGDGTRDATQDELVEIVNNSDSAADISGWTLADGYKVRHIFPAGTAVSAHCAIVVFGGGTPTGSFGGAVVQTASTGSLGLNNSGDTITLNDGSTDQATVTYGGEGGDDQSLTRDPDITGAFVQHSTATGSGGALFSPGTMIDGSSFPGCGPAFGACGDPAAFIHDLQGNGAVSPLNGESGVVIEGVVVGDFQGADEFRGFFVQEEDADADADPATSEGVFVYDSGFGVDVSLGDVVRVMGDVTEYYDFTQLHNVSNVAVCSSGAGVTAATVDLPVADLADWEWYEGMLVTLPEELAATDHYNLHRYGEVVISAEGRLEIPTNQVAPGPDASAAQELNDRRQLLVDDGSTAEFPLAVPYLAADNTLRLGDTVTGLTGVLGYGFGKYRLHPTVPPVFVRANARTDAPGDVGGAIRVASLNLLNYWTTIDDGINEARGADSLAEFERQKAKTVPAILALGADIVGLQELENNGPVAIGDLVAALNDATAPGTWAAVPDPAYPGGLDSTNPIKVGIIYQTASVTPIGDPVADDDPAFSTDRPPIAQTFAAKASGEVFTLVVNHFKSKGCYDLTGPDDPNNDQGDGQGCYNHRRTLQAQALLDFVAELQAASGDDDVIVVGDLNSYAQEDPILILEGGLANLMDAFVPPADQYSYVYFGQAGLLDYAFATDSLAARTTGVDIWHINADEPRVLDYNDEVIDPAESSGDFSHDYVYNPDFYRSSDHDPVILGLTFNPPAAAFTPSATNVFVDETVTFHNESTGDEPLSFLWDFGDGSTSTQESPTHGWAEPGLYEVTLTASHDMGSSSASVEILVRPRTVPFDTFDVRYARIRWRKDDSRGYFTLYGRLELPEGYARDDLSRDLELALTIGEKSAADEISMKECGRVWYFRRKHNPSSEGVQITKAVIIWPKPGRSWPQPIFILRGKLSLPGVNYKTRPAEATVKLSLPVAGDQLAGRVTGEETISFRPLHHLWLYRSWRR